MAPNGWAKRCSPSRQPGARPPVCASCRHISTIPTGSAIVTERLQVRIAPRETLFLLEIWGDVAAVEDRLPATLPLPCRSWTAGNTRLLWWEPGTWLVRTPIAERDASLERLV